MTSKFSFMEYQTNQSCQSNMLLFLFNDNQSHQNPSATLHPPVYAIFHVVDALPSQMIISIDIMREMDMKIQLGYPDSIQFNIGGTLTTIPRSRKIPVRAAHTVVIPPGHEVLLTVCHSCIFWITSWADEQSRKTEPFLWSCLSTRGNPIVIKQDITQRKPHLSKQ